MLSETQQLFAWGRNYPKSMEIATPQRGPCPEESQE